jgi:hypothetical protein
MFLLCPESVAFFEHCAHGWKPDGLVASGWSRFRPRGLTLKAKTFTCLKTGHGTWKGRGTSVFADTESQAWQAAIACYHLAQRVRTNCFSAVQAASCSYREPAPVRNLPAAPSDLR